MKPLGAGTQKIEEETAALFPYAKIARLDSDTAQSKGFEKKVIKDFCNGDIDILIGTQMISKGFDFGNLTLVAVIAADSVIGMQSSAPMSVLISCCSSCAAVAADGRGAGCS